jgi:hypothetical protein
MNWHQFYYAFKNCPLTDDIKGMTLQHMAQPRRERTDRFALVCPSTYTFSNVIWPSRSKAQASLITLLCRRLARLHLFTLSILVRHSFCSSSDAWR